MALTMMPFDRSHTISHYCSVATMSLSCTVNETSSLISKNLKRSRDSEDTPFGGNISQAFLCINQHTTFEMPSFTNSKDMIARKFFKMGHLTLTTLIRT